MANGKTKKNKKKIWGNFVAEKKVEENIRRSFIGWRGKKKIAGSIPGRPRCFLPPITPHKERCKYVHMAEYGSIG